MEEYIEKMLSQIRCKKARPYIADEIRNHINDQKKTNIENGMSEEDAIKEAVRDMGDPVETGAYLDKIHRPGISVKLLVIIGILSIIGILIHYSLKICYVDNGLDASSLEVFKDGAFSGYIYSILQGFFVMLLIYLLDYTFIVKYSRIIGLALLVLGFLRALGLLARPGNGQMYIGYGPIMISVISLQMLFIPVYGAILYKLRRGKVVSIIEALIWIFIHTYILTMLNPMLNRACLVVINFLSLLSLLSLAIIRGWFGMQGKKVLITLLTVSITLFTIFIVYKYRLYLMMLSKGIKTSVDSDNLRSIRMLWNSLALFGKSHNDIFSKSLDYNGELIIVYVGNYFGIIGVVILILILSILVVFLFRTVLRQKNELGLIMGFGCGVVFVVNITLNIMCTFGLLPLGVSSLPFISLNRSNMILSYALLGIVMNIYKYKDIYPSYAHVSHS